MGLSFNFASHLSRSLEHWIYSRDSRRRSGISIFFGQCWTLNVLVPCFCRTLWEIVKEKRRGDGCTYFVCAIVLCQWISTYGWFGISPCRHWELMMANNNWMADYQTGNGSYRYVYSVFLGWEGRPCRTLAHDIWIIINNNIICTIMSTWLGVCYW